MEEKRPTIHDENQKCLGTLWIAESKIKTETKPCEVHKLINGNENHPTLQKHNRKQIHFCFLSIEQMEQSSAEQTNFNWNANNNHNFMYVETNKSKKNVAHTLYTDKLA